MGGAFEQASHATLNWPAIGVAAIAAFMVGGFWYSKLAFGPLWMKLNGITQDDAKKGNVAAIMGGAFALTILTAYCVARLMLIGGGWQGGARVGLFVGAAVAFGIAIDHRFEMRPLTLTLINASHHLATCVLIGAILGAWG